jgi:hypothetical protein
MRSENLNNVCRQCWAKIIKGKLSRFQQYADKYEETYDIKELRVTYIKYRGTKS